eukprot:scaffold308889_cov37-Prasinocladus_malaysianus.AAC.2
MSWQRAKQFLSLALKPCTKAVLIALSAEIAERMNSINYLLISRAGNPNARIRARIPDFESCIFLYNAQI